MKDKTILFTNAMLNPPSGFACLGGKDVIAAKISDHHPVIHDGVFFWNIMMQCNIRGNGPNFNNGFGLVESDKDYTARLMMVARVIAETVHRDPSIEVIGLCEGPIKPDDIKALYKALMKFPSMARFMSEDMFYKPASPGQSWGLLMLADARYTVTKVRYDLIEDYPKLANRFQLWKLEGTDSEKYFALAHFPFAGDEYKTERTSLSSSGNEYCRLINALMSRYRDDSLILSADFNFSPYLISKWQERSLDKISHHNSILLTFDGAHHELVDTVTVDGVLLSSKEKQKYQSSRSEPELMEQLTSEYRLFKSYVKQELIEQDKQLAKRSSLNI